MTNRRTFLLGIAALRTKLAAAAPSPPGRRISAGRVPRHLRPQPRRAFRHLADYVDRILKGARAGSLPVELPTRVELAVNLSTAKALGFTIPQSVLLRADQVIQ